MRGSWALILIVAPPALVAFAIVLDGWTRRGYGLGLLAIVALVLEVWISIIATQAVQSSNASHTDNLDVAVVAALYFFTGLYVALALTLGAIFETLITRQWRWLAIIVTVSFAPLIISASTSALVPDALGALGLQRAGASLVLLLPPVLVTLAYAIVRIIRRPLASQGEGLPS